MERFTLLQVGLLSLLITNQIACNKRFYNQTLTREFRTSNESTAAVCSVVGGKSDGFISAEIKAGIRVSCTGQCDGIDYRSRKFYILNEENVAAIEFAATLKNGKEIRDLYIFSPSGNINNSLGNISLENFDVLKSLSQYGFDPNILRSVTFPADGKILLYTGTKASLSQAGLLDGGTLDCGGHPIDGSVELDSFKFENLNETKRSAALQD